MKTILKPFALIFLVVAFVSASAQERQIGLHIGAGTTDNSFNRGIEFGIGADGFYPIGENVLAVGRVGFNRFSDSGLIAHTFAARGEVRYHFVSATKANEHFFGLRPFALAGLDLQRYKRAIIKQAFLSPALGAGVNYNDLVTLQYLYAFPDMISAQSLRAHVLRSDIFVPLGKSWRGRLGFEYQRQRTTVPVAGNRFQATIGASKVF